MKLKSNLYAPIFFGVILVFAGLAGPIVNVAKKFEMDLFLTSTIIQLIVYLLPLAFYCKVRQIDVISTMKFRYVSPSKIPFLVNMALIFFVGSILFRYLGLFFFDSAMVSTPSAILIPVGSENLFLTILSTILLPAVFEELVFRGILLEEYRIYGSYWSVAVSSILFAMLHLSLENFVYYLF
ncbi:MAG: CPBP family intramembrane metalloprotease, partial [Clostridia bacterium]|nr:CPBP family intramembrane metalloprotease [Clostridia bacterium]